MERQLLERMIGAGVLVIALVIIAPALLDGQHPENRVSRTVPLPGTGGDLRTVTIRPDRRAQGPPVARDVAIPKDAAGLSGGVARPVPPSPVQGESAPGPGTVKPGTVKPGTVKPGTVKKSLPGAATGSVKGSGVEQPGPASAGSVAQPASRPAANHAQRTAAQGAPSGAGWAVQLGSFSSQDNAQRLVTQVRGRGFPAYFLPTGRSGGKTLYRVRVGPRADRREAARLAAALQKAGYRGQIVAP